MTARVAPPDGFDAASASELSGSDDGCPEQAVLEDDWVGLQHQVATAADRPLARWEAGLAAAVRQDSREAFDLLWPVVTDPRARFRTLCLAAYLGRTGWVQAMVAAGTDLLAENSYPLRSAIEGGHEDLVAWLLPRSAPNDPEGLTLEWALADPHLLDRVWPHVSPSAALRRFEHEGKWAEMDQVFARMPAEEVQAWIQRRGLTRDFPRARAAHRQAALSDGAVVMPSRQVLPRRRG